MIYFVRSGQYVKIGKANDPQARMNALQSASAEPLEMLITIPGGVKVEKALHARFTEKRVSREWFLLTNEEVLDAADDFRVMEAANIEEALGRQNWLSVLTFDVVKYIGAGGEVAIEWTAEGLTLRLAGVEPDTSGVHGRFLALADAQQPAPQEHPTPLSATP